MVSKSFGELFATRHLASWSNLDPRSNLNGDEPDRFVQRLRADAVGLATSGSTAIAQRAARSRRRTRVVITVRIGTQVASGNASKYGG